MDYPSQHMTKRQLRELGLPREFLNEVAPICARRVGTKKKAPLLFNTEQLEELRREYFK